MGNKRGSRVRGLNEKIYNSLIERKMSMHELSKKTGISVATISNIINYDIQPTSSILAKICIALEISADWVLGISDATKSLNPDKDAIREYALKILETVNE